MVRTFSIHSEEIAKFLGTALLNADQMAVVSPWVSDITVRFPDSNRIPDQRLRFSEAVQALDIDLEVFVDPDQDHHNRRKPTSLLPRISGHVPVHEIDGLHAKAIVTDRVLYQGSANMTYNGLNVNIELCDIRENEHGDVDQFLENRLGIDPNRQSI
jgi:phosphatidylserine/phosphatidylglycerophosphate/cardiolipin synthase-like enzyme